MKQKVLYVSYTGILEALGSSQVINYLIGLSEDYEIHLLSFERPLTKGEADLLEETELKLSRCGIKWKYHWYKNLGFGLGFFINLMKMIAGSYSIIKNENISLVHCRSYTPTISTYLIKKIRPIKYIFDMRGFWFDERADIGQISKTGFLYKFLKWIERLLLNDADHIVSLTYKGADLLKNESVFAIKNSNISVIPTCTDLERFKPNRTTSDIDSLVVGYVGTVSGWYDFEFTLRIFKAIKSAIPSVKFVIYNGKEHSFIQSKLKEFNLDDEQVTVENIPFNQIHEKVQNIDVTVFNIQPVFSKQASAATKFGEFLGCGIPVITNTGVGDMDYFINTYKVGELVDTSHLEQYDFAKIIKGLLSEEVRISCREVAEKYFSLANGIEDYKNLYQRLLTK